MIRFRCPKCSEAMEAPAGMANEFLKCPNCQQVVQVPAPTPPKSAAQEPKPTMPAGPKIVDTDVIRFRCECGQAVSTHRRNAGKIGECPICREDVPIPHESTR